MKIVKKVFKFLFSLILIAVLAASGYILYDYSQNPEKYDSFAQMFQDKLTGKDQIVIEEVSPFVTPVMTLPMVNSQYTDSTFEPHAEFEPTKPIILCYGKDMGGNLYVPMADYCLDVKNHRLLIGPDFHEVDISQYACYNGDYRRIEVKEELLMTLEAGEYYIASDFLGENGEYYPALSALILEEETTFNSTERGFVAYGDEYAWIVNNLDDPKDLSFTFYNLGDNPIRALLFDSDTGGGYLTKDVDPEDYFINERGDTVTLKQEFLSRLPVNTTKKFAVRLANGDTLDMGWTVIGTIGNDSLHRLTISGPETYSLSQGGDYVATYEPNDCTRIHFFFFHHYPTDREGVELIKETLRGEDISAYLDMETQTITIPAEIMKDLIPNNGLHDLQIGYFINDVWFDAFLKFAVTD